MVASGRNVHHGEEALLTRIASLELENARLEALLGKQAEQLTFLSNHKTLASGMTGELLVASLVTGELTAYAAGHDVTSASGQKIEVKRAGRTMQSGRSHWQWNRILGQSAKKEFDWVLLIGEVEDAYKPKYRDPLAPFVIFLIPFSDVLEISSPGVAGARRVKLTTNPSSVRGSLGRRLFSNYQITASELTEKFKLAAAL